MCFYLDANSSSHWLSVCSFLVHFQPLATTCCVGEVSTSSLWFFHKQKCAAFCLQGATATFVRIAAIPSLQIRFRKPFLQHGQ